MSKATIYYHDIGDYLTQAEKLAIITKFHSVAGIEQEKAWQHITPDSHHDWVNQRDDSFGEFIVIGSKGRTETAIFEVYSLGLTTNRDAWCYSASANALERNMGATIKFYNRERLLHP